MATENRWRRTIDERPPTGADVDWITPSGDQINGGKFSGGAIWLLPPRHEMYVYYTPERWRFSAPVQAVAP